MSNLNSNYWGTIVGQTISQQTSKNSNVIWNPTIFTTQQTTTIPVTGQPYVIGSGNYSNNYGNGNYVPIVPWMVVRADMLKYVSDEKSARRFFQLYLCADRDINPIQLLKDCVYTEYPQYKETLDTLLALVE